MDKPMVATKVTKRVVQTDEWTHLLECRFENEVGETRIVHLTKSVIELLGIDSKILEGSVRTSPLQRLGKPGREL